MTAAQGAAVMASAVAGRFAPQRQSKLTRTFAARRDVLKRWQTQCAAVRDQRRPLVWFHAPSVGEGLQARPIMQALRRARADVQIAYSFFSPSAETFARTLDADIVDYLPFDSSANAQALLQVLQPSALFFVKLDVWPTLVAVAKEHNVPVGLLSATLSGESGRRSTVARALLHDAYAALNVIGAIDSADARRLEELGARADRVHVSGDTRFDQVWDRAQTVNRDAPMLRALQSTRPTLVAGSTWPADEAVLLPAWLRVRRQIPSARLLIVPHEPTADHVEPILAWAKQQQLTAQTLSAVEREYASTVAENASGNSSGNTSVDVSGDASDKAAGNTSGENSGHNSDDAIASANTTDVVVVDRVGALGVLYALADVAFVGGGFHKAGLHSVIEPAAFGIPVAFGPGFGMSREAMLLRERDAARAVADVSECAGVLGDWLSDAKARASSGNAARTFVESELGAAERSLRLVLGTIGPG